MVSLRPANPVFTSTFCFSRSAKIDLCHLCEFFRCCFEPNKCRKRELLKLVQTIHSMIGNPKDAYHFCSPVFLPYLPITNRILRWLVTVVNLMQDNYCEKVAVYNCFTKILHPNRPFRITCRPNSM